MVVDRENPYRCVSVAGRAEITDEGAVEHIDKLAHKYTGGPFGDRPNEHRLIVRVRPERVASYGFDQ